MPPCAPVVVTDEVLDRLLARPNHFQIPCLQFLKASPAHKRCSRCPNSAPVSARRIDGEHARICISQLPPERLLEMKRALGADRLILYLTTPGVPRRTII